jgi:RNA polymerase sigma factor (TIGR02999 family)
LGGFLKQLFKNHLHRSNFFSLYSPAETMTASQKGAIIRATCDARQTEGEAMTTPSPQSVTQLLRAWSRGDQSALAQLTPLVYEELRRLARRYMEQERPGHTLQTTALVNEAYLRLVDLKQMRWQDRAHFLAVAAQVMRRILVEFARRRRRHKRGGEAQRVSLDEALEVSQERAVDLVALDDALSALTRLDRRKSQVVELRFFGGLSVEETAEVLKVSPDTVRREWDKARAWLYQELSTRATSDE